jgi:hypothetical protein
VRGLVKGRVFCLESSISVASLSKTNTAMTELKNILLQLNDNLNTLREHEAKYATKPGKSE